VKNQYFGDVNDYRKYGLLRCFQDAGFSIGICWMLTPNDSSDDGGKTRYLENPGTWRQRDPELFDYLRGCVADGRRNVQAIENSPLLTGASFFSEVLPDDLASRVAYFRRALERLRTADLLFLDPDNGIEVRSTGLGQRGSSKYVYWQEVAVLAELGMSVLVFQHWNRKPREAFGAMLRRELGARFPTARVLSIESPFVLFLGAFQAGQIASYESARDLIAKRWGGDLAIRD
jgi:hypothetical protein